MICDSSGAIQSHLHKDSLLGLCRICGERAKKSAEKIIPKLCASYPADILQVYRVNISNDDVNLHPPKMCNRCYLMMKKSLRTQDIRVFENSFQRLVTNSFWSPHSDDSCQVCTQFTQQTEIDNYACFVCIELYSLLSCDLTLPSPSELDSIHVHWHQPE